MVRAAHRVSRCCLSILLPCCRSFFSPRAFKTAHRESFLLGKPERLQASIAPETLQDVSSDPVDIIDRWELSRGEALKRARGPTQHTRHLQHQALLLVYACANDLPDLTGEQMRHHLFGWISEDQLLIEVFHWFFHLARAL